MEYDKAAKHLTGEIIQEFHLPTHLCYSFIHQRICMAIGVGFDIGRGPEHRHHGKPVESVDRNGNVTKTYSAMILAARDVKGHPDCISYAIKTERFYKGHKWRFIDVKGMSIYKRKSPINL
jgi:hypothetical protein